MVRLKVLDGSNDIRDYPNFQFHYGTIKSSPKLIELVKATFFQFHYGTIKSVGDMDKWFLPANFQFHYGTIKSSVPSNKPLACSSFNSTMVRLKDSLWKSS